MLTQAMHSNEPYLRQLPHCSPALLERAKEMKVESVFELLELEDDAREKLLDMNENQLVDVARFCNHYPSIEVKYELGTNTVNPYVGTCLPNPTIFREDRVEVTVDMERENDIDGLAPPVVAPFFPQKRKEEGWWLVVGDPDAKSNILYSIKRFV